MYSSIFVFETMNTNQLYVCILFEDVINHSIVYVRQQCPYIET